MLCHESRNYRHDTVCLCTWQQKPRNWRKRYAYRPMSLDALGALSETQIAQQVPACIGWLAGARGVSLPEAKCLAESRKRGELLSSKDVRESTASAEEWPSPSVSVRTVKVWSQAYRQHHGFELPRYGSEAVPGWHKMVVKSHAPTTYRVVVDGHYVDSYLTRAWASSAAQAIVDRAELAAIHTTSGSCLAA